MTKQFSAHAAQASFNEIWAINPHLRPLILAALNNGIYLNLVPQHAGPIVSLARLLPSILILFDDPGISLGVAAFDCPSVVEFARRAKLAVVSSCALDPQLYMFALVLTTGRHWDVLFIETRLKHAQEWISTVEKANPEIQFIIANACAA